MRISHVLRPNKTAASFTHLIFFDTETTSKQISNTETRLTLKLGIAKYYRKRGDKGYVNEAQIQFTTATEFWDFVEKHVHTKETTYLFAHNTAFDFRIVKGYDQLKQRDWTITFDTFSSLPFIMHVKKDKRHLHIYDTMNYFKASVKQIGDAIDLPKLEVAFNDVSDEDLLIYCERDVDIISKALLDLINLFKRSNYGNFGHTIAKIAFNAYKHRFMNYPIHIHTFPDIIKIERESYKGGRTEVFYQGKFKPPYPDLYDVKSMYPSVMLFNEFPTEFKAHVKRASITELHKYMKDYLVIVRCKIRITKPAVCHRVTKNIYPIGTFTDTFTTPEIEVIEEYGEILEIYDLILYNHAPIFKDYITHFFKERNQAKEEGNKVYDYFYKIIMNSLYGKFGQRSEHWEEVGEANNNIDESYQEIDFLTKKRIFTRIVNGKIWVKTGFQEGFDTFISIASFVTAYARCKLWSYIGKCYPEHVFYCDTDSVVVDAAGVNILQNDIKEGMIGGLEEKDEQFISINAPKDYVSTQQTRIKGIRKDAIKLNENTYKQEMFEGVRTGIHKQRLNEMVISEHIKVLKRNITSGVKQPDGMINPFNLS